MPPDPAPLILTLQLDERAQAWFDAQRRRYFPADRVQVGAHVTLFHALPGGLEPDVVRHVAALCRDTAVLPVEVAGLRFLGRGVAYTLRAPGALAVRARLRAAFAHALTAQDAASWSPHVTVQNKVAPDEARRTQAALAAQAWPAEVQATGVAVWRYRGGPWEAVTATAFSAGLTLAGVPGEVA